MIRLGLMGRWACVALGLGMLAAVGAGCDDDDGEVKPTGPGNILEVAEADGRFETLLAAIEAAGLNATLTGAGPFTVFAPTDAAFDALPEGALDALLADPDALEEVLLYHVVARAVPSSEIVTLAELTTVQGDTVAITVSNGTVMINDATVVTADVEASNGIIHVIDAVLLPPEPGPGTIIEVATAAGDFTTLLAAVEAAGLTATLSGDGPFTVFAPTDAAFDALPEGALDALLADPDALEEVLLYHVVARAVPSSEIVTLAELTTVQGDTVAITVSNGTVMINDATVVTADVEASNGIIHVIDAVLLPPEPGPGTIIEVATAAGDFTTLLAAVEAAGLTATLSGDGPFTVFAPTDAAFDALPEGALDALLADPDALGEVLLYHVVADSVPSSEIVTLAELTTVQGETVAITVSNGTVMINDATVVTADVEASNGIIHVIDAVLLPPTE